MTGPLPLQLSPDCDIIDTETRCEVRCPQSGCGRLLFYASHWVFIPGVSIEIKCSRCGAIVVWPVAAAAIKTE